MSLDVFAGSIAAADQDVMRNAAADLPAEFSESAGMAWRSMTQWHNSNAQFNARDAVLGEYIDHVREKTGETLPMPRELATATSDIVTLDDFNAAQAKINEKNPTAMLRPLSDDDLSAMTTRKLRATHQEMDDFSRREGTWGGTAGTILGTLGGGLADPVAVASLALGGAGEAGIALRALEFAGIAGGTEALTAASTYRAHEAAVPGSSKEIPGQIAGATIFGGMLGAGFGVLSKLAGHGARPLPTSIRDEVNAATSEAQFAVSNPFPTAAGESAARDAHVDATNAMLRGDPVTSGERFDASHVADYAIAAKADGPEAFALDGERHLRPETYGDVPDVERFDAMPGSADDAASYWESRIADASPEERAAFGATDADVPKRAVNLVEQTDVQLGSMQKAYSIAGPDGENLGTMVVTKMGDLARIENIEVVEGSNTLGASNMRSLLRQFREANPEIRELSGERISGARFGGKEVYEGDHVSLRLPEIAARDLSPAEITKLAADPATESSVLHNLEHIAEANPDMEFTTQIRRPDGTYQFTTQKLSDVLAEFDGWETAAKEIEACAVGGALEAAE